MTTFRVTQALRRRLPTSAPLASDARPTTALLGDWYATHLAVRPAHLVLAVSQRTRLPVILPAKPLATLIPRFREEAIAVLRALGVVEAALQAERAAMEEVSLALTSGGPEWKSVLGTLNEFTLFARYDLDAWAETRPLLAISLNLGQTPCGPLKMESPARVTQALFRL